MIDDKAGDSRLTPKELSEFADRLNSDTLGVYGYFGIFRNGENTGGSHIKANAEGLKLFTAQLVESISKLEGNPPMQREDLMVLDSDEAWIDEESHTVISHIEVVDKSSLEGTRAESPETVKEQAMKYGCILTAVFLFFALITGVVTIIKWLF